MGSTMGNGGYSDDWGLVASVASPEADRVGGDPAARHRRQGTPRRGPGLRQ